MLIVACSPRRCCWWFLTVTWFWWCRARSMRVTASFHSSERGLDDEDIFFEDRFTDYLKVLQVPVCT